jgi:CHASE3 domain sensor protein
MDDADVLKDLRNWNEAKLIELQEWLPSLTDHEREAAEQRIRAYEQERRA